LRWINSRSTIQQPYNQNAAHIAAAIVPSIEPSFVRRPEYGRLVHRRIH
jgi:hypothetical protein